MLEKDLEKLGLNEKEARVYLALLELGEGNVEQISKKSDVRRTTVYDIIDSLKDKGLLFSVRKNKRELFYAEDPRKFEDTLEEKKHTLGKILPELLSITNALDKKPKIRFYEGLEGVKDVYEDTLKYPNQEILAWVSEEAVTVFDEKFLMEHYLPKRIKKRIWVRAIGPDNSEMRKYKDSDEKALRKTKLISMSLFPIEVEIDLYGKSKIGIMSFDEKIGLIIESRKIHTTLKSIFELNWNLLK